MKQLLWAALLLAGCREDPLPAAGLPGRSRPLAISHVRVLTLDALEQPSGTPARPPLISPDNVIHLELDQNNVILYFSEHPRPRRPLYCYGIAGYIKDSITVSDSFAVLTNIPKNGMIFWVRSLSQPNLKPVEYKIQVTPSFWLQPWFFLLIICFGLGLMGLSAYFIYRYRVRQLMQLQHVREQIARNLHDDLGSYLSSISIMSQTASRLTDTDKTLSLIHI